MVQDLVWTPVKKTKSNIVEIGDDVSIIYLNSRKYPGYYAIVDTLSLDTILKYTWNVRVCTEAIAYAVTQSRECRTVYMHQIVLGAESLGKIVDHIDGNSLNNTKSNLRVCTTSQNNKNIRKVRGDNPYVGVQKSYKDKFRADITIQANGLKRKISLGTFEDAQVAAKVRDAAARYYFGEFAGLNFPEYTDFVYNPLTFETPYKAKKPSKHLEIYYRKVNDKWEARFKGIYLGVFDSEEDAYNARKEFEITETRQRNA